MEKPEETPSEPFDISKRADMTTEADVKPIELNENALLMGFMADFGRKVSETIKTERSAPVEPLAQALPSDSENTSRSEIPSARSEPATK